MPATSRVRRLLAVLTMGTVGVVAQGLAATPASATPWGTTGADYSGGLVCRLPDATVPMAHWSVNGAPAFSTADVVARGSLYGPAPTDGASATMTDGTAGLSGADIATIAYLIDRYGSGSAVEVAETSADIAGLTGNGATQARCLGQQGTSRSHAAALLAEARRYAGPYSVTVGAAGRATGSGRLPVSAIIRSPGGAGVPGVQVQFTASSGIVTATTDSDGVARTTVPAQRTASTLLAAVDAPTTLTYVATDPAAVAAAEPTRFTGTAPLAAVTPRPAVSVTGSTDLVLSGGRATPSAQVTGTFGYSGSGTLTVVGPVDAGDGKSCSAVSDRDFAGAPTVSTAPFTFGGDTRFRAGATPALKAGCYLAQASVATTDSGSPVKATSPVDDGSVITVASVALAQASLARVSPAGGLRATVTATDPGRARVTSSLVARGPLGTDTGECTGSDLDWSAAPTAGGSEPVELTAPQSGSPAGGDPSSLAATISTSRVGAVGCYSVVSRSTVTLDGKSVTVEGQPGTSGTTTLVAEPRVAIVNSDYDGEIGKPMAGSITVSGSYRFAGRISVGLIATNLPDGGCHPVTFASRTAVVKPTLLATKGDGTYTFRSPRPTRNLCYAVTAVLSLDANQAVRSNSPSPSANTIFLAGVSLTPKRLAELPALRDRSVLRPVLTVGIIYGLLFVIASFIVVKAASARRPDLLRGPSAR